MPNPTISQIAINGTTYDACDSQARADIKTLQDSVINGVGDINTHKIAVKSTNIDINGANPSSERWGNALRFTDNNEQNIAYSQPVKRTNGTTNLTTYVLNTKTDGTQIYNSLVLGIGKDGTCSYYVEDPAAFRDAINAVDRNAVLLNNAFSVEIYHSDYWAIGFRLKINDNLTYAIGFRESEAALYVTQNGQSSEVKRWT